MPQRSDVPGSPYGPSKRLSIDTPGVVGIRHDGDSDDDMRLRSITVRSTHGVKALRSSTEMRIEGDRLVLDVRGILRDLRLPLSLLEQFLAEVGSAR